MATCSFACVSWGRNRVRFFITYTSNWHYCISQPALYNYTAVTSTAVFVTAVALSLTGKILPQSLNYLEGKGAAVASDAKQCEMKLQETK